MISRVVSAVAVGLAIGVAVAMTPPTQTTFRRGPDLIRIVVTALATTAAIAVAIVHRAEPAAAAALAAMVVVLAVLADIDLRTRRLPNRIVGPLAIATLIAVCVGGVVTNDMGRAAVAVGVGVAFVAAMLSMHVAGGMGMGDVKLGFPIGAVAGWLGTDAVLATVFVAAVTGALAAAVVMTRARTTSTKFSYGPYLALGSAAGMLVEGVGL